MISKDLVTWLLCTNTVDEKLYRAVESCLNQSIPDINIILVVNGSGHVENARILTDHYSNKDTVKVISTEISKLNHSLNLGIDNIHTKYVARMDCDDVCSRDRLEKQLKFLEDNPNVAIVGSSYLRIDQNGTIGRHVSLPSNDKKIRKLLRYSNPLCHPSIIFRRDVVLKLGGYMGGEKAQDYDLWVRVAISTNWKFANINEPLLLYNDDPNGSARRSATAYSNVAASQLKAFLFTLDIRWAFGLFVSCVKFFIKSNKY